MWVPYSNLYIVICMPVILVYIMLHTSSATPMNEKCASLCSRISFNTARCSFFERSQVHRQTQFTSRILVYAGLMLMTLFKSVLVWLLSPIPPTVGTFKFALNTELPLFFYAIIPKVNLSLEIRQKWKDEVQQMKISSGWNCLCMRLIKVRKCNQNKH